MFLQARQMEKSLSTWQKQWLTKKAKPLTIKNEVLYRWGRTTY
jgi:hypothetical protein